MQAWKGWTPAIPSTPTTRARTWAEWCAGQQRTLRDEARGQEHVQLTDKELARLAFLRWLYQAGHFGPRRQDSV